MNLAALAASGTYELTGTDVSAEALALAGGRTSGVRLLPLDIERESIQARFDLVISIQVVEHVVDDVAALRNMASMAAKYVFTSTMAGRMRRSEPAIGHVRNYSKIELRRKLELAGLDVLWLRGWGFPWYSPLYRTAAEWLPGGPPSGQLTRGTRAAAAALHGLYRLNVPGRGDVISALARVPGS